MSKSLAQKKSAKKKKGERTARGGGHRATRAAVRDYKRDRAIQTSHAQKPKATVMMAPRRRVLNPVRFERTDWTRVADADVPTERATLTAFFADGSSMGFEASVTYAHGERERILQPVIEGRGTEDEVRELQRLLFRRSAALQDAYARAQHACIVVPAEILRDAA